MHKRWVEPLRRPWQDAPAGLDWSGGNGKKEKEDTF